MKEEKEKNRKKDWRKDHLQEKKEKNRKNNLGGSYKFRLLKSIVNLKLEVIKLKIEKRNNCLTFPSVA